MKILHFMVSGGTGGIEILNKEYAKYSKLENIYVFFWGGGCIADEMRVAGNRTVELNASKINFLGPLKRIFHLCKKEKPNAIVIHYKAPVLYLYVQFIKIIFPKIRIFAYVHENVDVRSEKDKGIRGAVKHFIINRFFNRANGVIVISDFVKKSLIKRYRVSENKIEKIYNGVDLGRFKYPIHEAQDQIECIYVGRLTKEKGVQNIICALARLSKDVSWHFRIVGEGEYRSVLEKWVRECQLDERITFLGNRRDIPELLAQSDIFLHMPEGEEGFGIAVVEAMAAGLLCVCAQSGAIPEIIAHNKSGYLIKDVKSEEISRKLRSVMNVIKSDKIGEIRAEARNQAKGYAIELYAKKLDDYFKIKCM